VRILAATHRDLEAMCDAEAFRWDLFFRLNTMTLHVPPLRDRPEEIEPLALHFLQLARSEHGSRVSAISQEALVLLGCYGWPGNVRELRNEVERAAVIARGSAIEAADLSRRVRPPAEEGPGTAGAGAGISRPIPRQALPAAPVEAPAAAAQEEPSLLEEGVEFKVMVQRYETRLLLEALRRTDWNQTATARLLNIPPRTLTNKMTAYDLRRRR
jgi:DNA-binding NtrC family response regulator